MCYCVCVTNLAGRLIGDEMKERGWCVGKLATKLGIPRSRLEDIINGQPMKLNEMDGLAKALGTSITLWDNLQTEDMKMKIRSRG